MKKLREYRVKNNFSYEFMAYLLNISKTFYWQIENDKKRLSYDLAVSIADIFHMTPDELFYDDFKNMGI
jgi:putative transcriptional regulator